MTFPLEKANSYQLISSGALPSWLGRVRDADLGTSWCLAATEEGKVVVWGSEMFAEKAESLSHVIDVPDFLFRGCRCRPLFYIRIVRLHFTGNTLPHVGVCYDVFYLA